MMKKLDDSLEKAYFFGFPVLRGCWYGRNLAGMPIASNGLRSGKHVWVYKKGPGGWQGEWVYYGDRAFRRFYGGEFQDSLEADEEAYFQHLMVGHVREAIGKGGLS